MLTVAAVKMEPIVTQSTDLAPVQLAILATGVNKSVTSGNMGWIVYRIVCV